MTDINILCRAWIARRSKLDQCLELQLFNRDCEQAETWMAARESSLEDSVDGAGDSVEALLKRHEDFDRAIASQEEKITAINNLAEQVNINNPVFLSKLFLIFVNFYNLCDIDVIFGTVMCFGY